MCDCASAFHVELGRACRADYRRAKTLLNRGVHPTFVGPDMVIRKASNGGLWFYCLGGVDVAVTVVNPRLGVLLVLNVHPEHRSHGLGRSIIRLLRPPWVRALVSVTPWFEGLGYVRVGERKRGHRLETDLLVQGDLLHLAGRLRRVFRPLAAELERDHGEQGLRGVHRTVSLAGGDGRESHDPGIQARPAVPMREYDAASQPTGRLIPAGAVPTVLDRLGAAREGAEILGLKGHEERAHTLRVQAHPEGRKLRHMPQRRALL